MNEQTKKDEESQPKTLEEIRQFLEGNLAKYERANAHLYKAGKATTLAVKLISAIAEKSIKRILSKELQLNRTSRILLQFGDFMDKSSRPIDIDRLYCKVYGERVWAWKEGYRKALENLDLVLDSIKNHEKPKQINETKYEPLSYFSMYGPGYRESIRQKVLSRKITKKEFLEHLTKEYDSHRKEQLESYTYEQREDAREDAEKFYSLIKEVVETHPEGTTMQDYMSPRKTETREISEEEWEAYKKEHLNNEEVK